MSKLQVGSRAFTRRKRVQQRKRGVPQRPAAAPGLSALAARLPAFTLRRSYRPGILPLIPRAARVCALVACLNAICWSLVTPPFQVPDEPDHFAYVKELAETGRMPTSSSEQLSSEEIDALQGLRNFQVRLQPQVRAIATQAEEQRLRHDLALASGEPSRGSPNAGVATSEPPLYYTIEAIPYSLSQSGSVLVRLQFMRLVSALFAGITALFVFLFVRETLPASPWSWTVAGLSVALLPLLGFMSGSVNPDSLLFAVSAAIFYALARAFRCGLGTGEAIAIGGLTAAGFMTKLNFVGLAPGVVLGLLALSIREVRRSGRLGYRLLALGSAIAMSPVALYVLFNVLTHRRALGIVSRAASSSHGSLLAQLNYIWQLYLPRLPGTVNDFPSMFPMRQLWFNGFVGLYGWLDTPLPSWVQTLALVPALAILMLAARSLALARRAMRARAVELTVYVTIAVGLMLLIGADSYHAFPGTDAEYGQVRYLLPLLPLLGAVLALAARGAGRRWGPAVGALVVALFIAHDLFSQLQVVARFYG